MLDKDIYCPHIYLICEHIMNMAKLEEIVLGLKNEDGNCNKLRAANDTTLLAESKDSDDLVVREVRMENVKSKFMSKY